MCILRYFSFLETDSGRLWYNPAKYAQAQSPHQGWPMTNVPNSRYTLQQQAVPAPHPILIPHNDPPPQLVKQQSSVPQPSQQPKTNSISIEKISAPQQDFTIHRRLLSNVPPPSAQPQAAPGTFFTPSGQIVYPEYIAQNRDFPSK